MEWLRTGLAVRKAEASTDRGAGFGALAANLKSACTIPDLLFFIPFGIWLLAKLVQRSSFSAFVDDATLFSNTMVLCMVVLAVREVVFGKHDRDALLWCVVVAVFAELAFHAHYQELCDTALIVFFARDIGFKRLVVLWFAIMVPFLAVTFASVAIGVLPDIVYEDEGWRGARHCLGFAHPNGGGAYTLMAALAWAAIRNRDYGLADGVVTLAVTLGVYYFTSCRSMLVGVVILLVLQVVRVALPGRVASWKSVRCTAVSFTAVVIAVTLALCFAYDPESGWMAFLDHLTSGRLRLAHENIVAYGITPWGQEMPYGATSGYSVTTGEWVQRNASTLVDCAYARMLLHCGLACLLAYVALCTAAAKCCLDQGEWVYLAILAVVALYGVMEGAVLSAVYCPFVFLLALPMAHALQGPSQEPVSP